MWFLVNRKAIRFSTHEFSLVTGLKFGNFPAPQSEISTWLQDTYFGWRILTLNEFRRLIMAMDMTAVLDTDTVKLTAYFVLESLILGRV